MRFYATESSMLASVAYDVDARPFPQLTVVFVGGGMYIYYDVPATEFARLLNAESIGKYFASNIKGKYFTDRLV